MLREFKENMAGMFSLMERMDKHMTKSCAERNVESYLNEAMAQNGTVNRLEPNVFVAITEDPNNRKKIINIKILPLYKQDIMAIKRTAPYSTDSKCSAYRDGRGEGISFFKYLPFKDKKLKTDDTANQPQQQQPSTDAQQKQNQPTDDTQQAAKPKSKLASKLASRLANKQAQPQQQDNSNGVVTEGLGDKLKAKVAAKNGQQPQAAQAQQMAQAQQQQMDVHTQGEDDLLKWLRTYYMGIVNIIAKNPSYNHASIDKLKDIANIYQICRSTPTKSDKVYAEKSSDEMKTEIAKAIADGKWDTYLRTNINPLNLESLIFGNVLSMRNQGIVKRRAQDEGINPGDPNYPTLVLAPGQWAKFFNRQIVDNPRISYPLMTPRMLDRGTTRKLTGTEGHERSFGTKNKGFQYFLGYDISDTEPIDPNDTTDYVNGIAGIINNLTGELNQLAIDAKEAALAAKQANLTDEQKDAIAEVQTEDGQAKIFNRALMSYVEQFNVAVSLIDCDNSNQAVFDYAKNIVTVTKKSVELAGYSNPSIAGPLAIIAAFGIACYTIGTNEVLAIGRQNGTYTSDLKGDWDKMGNSVMSTIAGVIRHIYSYLNSVYSPLEGNNDASNPTVAPTDSTDAAQGAQQPINESKDYYSKIEDILNSL